ncbi:MAG: hypothetical protein WAK69_07910 [Rhodoplanes sp.]
MTEHSVSSQGCFVPTAAQVSRRVILPFQAPAVRAQKSFVRMIRLSDFAGKDIVPPF